MQAYKLGNFNQIAEIYELKKRILRSLNYSLTETERLLLDLVDKATSHATVNTTYSNSMTYRYMLFESKLL